ncbi:MAG: aromatic amino acid lyase, partial [Pseudomonas sp.]
MIHFDPAGLTIEDLLSIARQDAPADFSDAARQRIDEGHRLLLRLVAEGTPIYGVTTGLGAAVD